jgi:hypothetical protein
MYESPKLVVGNFRDLTLQTCQTVFPYGGKDEPVFDSIFPQGTTTAAQLFGRNTLHG